VVRSPEDFVINYVNKKMLFVVTGNGKGKTTAAIGQAIRVAGDGGKVWFGQFIKSPAWVTGEDKMFARIPEIDHHKLGLGFVGILNDTLPRSAHREAAQKGLAAAQATIKSGKYALVVLDEVNVAVSLRLLSAREVLRVARLPLAASHKSSPTCDVMLTGRSAPASFLRAGEIVTECLEVQHIFNNGVRGKKGREF
jgi:cob(I)alamin adenosyltransferase